MQSLVIDTYGDLVLFSWNGGAEDHPAGVGLASCGRVACELPPLHWLEPRQLRVDPHDSRAGPSAISRQLMPSPQSTPARGIGPGELPSSGDDTIQVQRSRDAWANPPAVARGMRDMIGARPPPHGRRSVYARGQS